MKKITIAIVVVIIIVLGIYYFGKDSSEPVPVTQEPTNTQPATTTATTTPQQNPGETVIGKSVEGRDIVAYNFGTGPKKLLFVGGIHGGYSSNTVAVAREAVDAFKEDPTMVPSGLSVTIIPILNPDGLNKLVGNNSPSDSVLASARFNSNDVDLNRNFDCDWQTKAKWQNKTVSGGSAAFSEPESLAIKNYIETAKPTAVVVWYSAAGGVFASNCHGGVSVETDALTKTFAKASGYPAHSSFDFYSTTGDMTNWLAKIGVPAVSVLLTNHTDTEWSKNEKGIKALLEYYSK